jgi:hypothetical protein
VDADVRTELSDVTDELLVRLTDNLIFLGLSFFHVTNRQPRRLAFRDHRTFNVTPELYIIRRYTRPCHFSQVQVQISM